jgi:CMP/dCMP kinase
VSKTATLAGRNQEPLALSVEDVIKAGGTPSDERPTGVIVTIDGTAGTGKSTVAKLLANRLNFDFLDTGAMYRACALLSIAHGIQINQSGPPPHQLLAVVQRAALHFDWSLPTPEICVFGNPVEGLIRTKPVTARVREVALIPELRDHLVRLQQLIGNQRPWLVTEGRDQGTAVFPSAPVKFFLDADLTLRAERRKRQVKDLADTPIAEIKHELDLRDRSDRSELGGLREPHDAVRLVNNSDDPSVIVEQMATLVRERMAARNLPGRP